MTFEELGKKHPRFIYRGFSSAAEGNDLKVVFDFLLEPDITFSPSVVFPNVSQERFNSIGKNILDNLFFNLGLIEMISYWKAACSPEIIVGAGNLDSTQKEFWRNLLIDGLGEFFYMNNIDFTKDDLVNFKSKEISENIWVFQGAAKDRSLVLVGGGKDSAVTLELFKEEGKGFTPLLLNPIKAAEDITNASEVTNPIMVRRTIDPKLLELNEKGYLNGHTPFSAYLAFLGVVAAVLYDYKDIVVSNEASSNEGNIEYLGKIVNHQYSKTFEFENKFRDYAKKYLSLSQNYYSFLRPLTELQIAKLFSKMEKYHSLFRSCNKGSKTNSWCGACAKCLFAYLILKPFLKEKIDAIFGKNLLESEDLKPLLSQLLREDDAAKPFDCVGLVDETKASLYLIHPQKYSYFKKYADTLENQWNEENNLPKDMADLLRKKVNGN